MREFTLLERVFALNSELPKRVVVGPGDDMALIALTSDCSLLAACDSAIEGVHAPWGCDPYGLGRKAILRNLSDVAAMINAAPTASLACVTLPRGVSEERAWRLFEGLRETAKAWGAPLIGGDVSKCPAETEHAPLVASVTILATPIDASRPVVTRSGARDGDAIYVTGTIGGAWDRKSGLGRHLDFEPRLRVARALLAMKSTTITAAIDVSDGLGRDLGHLATRSGVRLEFDLDRLPVTSGCAAHEAIMDGEDYELAFTARGEDPVEIAGVRITCIGRVVEGAVGVFAREAGECFDVSNLGFEHSDGSEAKQ